MGEKELIENAARAAGIDLIWNATEFGGKPKPGYWHETGFVKWNPLADRLQAYDLAATLGINVDIDHDSGMVRAYLPDGPEASGVAVGDPDKTARLFVECAAKRGLELAKDNPSVKKAKP